VKITPPRATVMPVRYNEDGAGENQSEPRPGMMDAMVSEVEARRMETDAKHLPSDYRE